MALTINHQTNDISATTAPTTIDNAKIGLVLLENVVASASIYAYDIPAGSPYTSYFLEFRRGTTTLNYPVWFRYRYSGSVVTGTYYNKIWYSNSTAASTAFSNNRFTTTNGILVNNYSSYYNQGNILMSDNAATCRVKFFGWDNSAAYTYMSQTAGTLNASTAVDGFEVTMGNSLVFDVSLYAYAKW